MMVCIPCDTPNGIMGCPRGYIFYLFFKSSLVIDINCLKIDWLLQVVGGKKKYFMSLFV